MKYLSLLLIGAAMVSASCNAQNKTKDGFTILPNGLQYKNIVHGNGTLEAKPGYTAKLNVVMKIGDSAVINTLKLNNGKPVNQTLTAPHGRGNLIAGLLKMKAGDSAIFRLDYDSMIAIDHRPREKWVKKGQVYVTWQVKMVELLTPEQNKMAMARAQVVQKSVDDSLILNYFKTHNIKNYQKTATGLYYVVHNAGNGPSPKTGQKVTVNYTGRMLDGSVFDSNTDPKFHHVQPFNFPLGKHRVIPGWDEGVALMHKGEKATFYIPSHLAYGSRGAGGGRIPPNTVLIFDIELTNFQ